MSTVESSPSKDARMEEEVEEMEDYEEEEEEEVDDDDEEVEEEEEEEEGIEVTVGRRSGRGLTLKTLLKEGILEPGDGNMTINYLGNRFKGDLLSDGRIRSQETGKIFGTPSAWAIYCKKIVNPDKKSGCGWASVRYRGKKLDTYKNNWFRQKRLEYEKEEEMEEDMSSEGEVCPPEQEIVEFEILGNRNPNHEPSTMVELATFQSVGRLQPFNITMSSSAMAVIDVHAHLSTSEVVGYLAGQWDVNNHNLIVSHALPVRCRLGDSKNGPMIEQELYAEMTRLKLSLVGWYHTHPFAPPLPSLRDIDSQLDYEMKMKGYNDASYTPILGIIVSPYQKSPIHTHGIPHPNGNATGYWVMPPPENKPLEYGKPMSMQFTVVQDAFIPKEALLHMSEIVKYYHESPDSVVFTDIFEDKITYWHKLKNSLQARVPKDHFPPLMDFLRKIIEAKLPEEDTALPPPPPPPPPISTSSVTPSVSTTSVSQTLPTIPATVTSPQTLPSNEIKTLSTPTLIDIPSSIPKEKEHSNKPTGLDALHATFVPTTENNSRERESLIHPLYSHSPSPSPSVQFSTPEKYSTDEESPLYPTSKPTEKTPPPKSYSPFFQHPPPPLFPIESSKSGNNKESHPISDSVSQPILHLDEKRPFELIQKGLSSLRASKTSSVEIEPPSVEVLRTNNKCSTPITKSVLQGTFSSLRESEPAFLDLSMSSNKNTAESTSSERSKKDINITKEIDERERAAPSLAAWFAQQQSYAQEVLSLPPHERDNPFLRDPFGIGTSHWNTGLNLTPQTSKTSTSSSSAIPSGIAQHDAIVSSFARKAADSSPTNFSFSLESLPTYHSSESTREFRDSVQQHRVEALAPTYIREEANEQRDSPSYLVSHRSRPDQPSNEYS